MSGDPAAGPAIGQATAFRCPNCAADLSFDASLQTLRCTHCGQTLSPPSGGQAQAVAEHDLNRALVEEKSRGFGVALRSTRCAECGATVSFPEQVVSTRCEFCGSAQVLSQEANRNLIRPESVVPFGIDGARATELFHRWLSRLWLRPSDLKRQARVTELAGVYVPYWTFDTRVDSVWTAEAGHYYYETETVQEKDPQGKVVTKTRQVRRVRWEPARGTRSDAYDDLLVCASKGLPPDLARQLRTFDTNCLRPYDPGYLAGWKAEEYGLDLNDAWRQAQERVVSRQRDRCAGDVPGDTQRNLQVTNRFSGETFKHVLLPVWMSSFRYHDRIFRFLVNGQTGEVVGQAPWSVLKIVLLVAAGLALLALLALASQQGG